MHEASTEPSGRTWVRWTIRASYVLWVLALLLLVARLALDVVFGDETCEAPRGSSNYGDASWRWWTPGIRCTYEAATIPGYGTITAHTDGPPAIYGTVLVVLVLWLAVTGIAKRRIHRAIATASPPDSRFASADRQDNTH